MKPTRWRTRLATAAVFLVTLAVYAALAPRLERRLNPVTGDEPFYLMTAHNLLAGRGLDETASWANADWRQLYPRLPTPPDWNGWPAFPIPLPPHDSKGTVPAGMYSKHGLGLSTLIAPFYAAGGRVAVGFLMNAVGALVAANIFLLALEASGRLWVGIASWLALAFSNPLMSYSFLIFPEIPAALLAGYAFRRIRQPSNNGWQTTGIAASIAVLPWLHARFALLAIALGTFWFWTHFWQAPKLRRISILPLLVPSISAAALFDYYFYLYRSFLPNAQDHGGTSGPLGTLNGIAGLFLDQQWGLLTAAPIYLLALACAIAMFVCCLRDSEFSVQNASTGWWLAITLPYFLLIANYRLWWGEWCPPARYLVAILPLLALPVGLIAARVSKPLLAAGLPLALASWAIMAVFMYDPQLMYNQPTGQAELFLFLQDRTGVDLTGLPSFITIGQ